MSNRKTGEGARVRLRSTAMNTTRSLAGSLLRLVTALSLAAASGIAAALPDDLDPAWGLHGTAWIDEPHVEFVDLAVTGDGYTYGNVGCVYYGRPGRRGLLRLHANGELDASFGVALGFTDCPPDFPVIDALMALTRKGQPLLISRNADGLDVLRYANRGLIEARFTAPLPPIPPEQSPFPGGIARLYSVAVDPHDRIVAGLSVICGDAYQCTPMVARWSAEGKLDASFGDGGVVFLPSPGAVVGVAFHPDDRMSIAIQDQLNIRIARLRPDGSLDPLFGNGGLVFIPPVAFHTTIRGIVIHQDDKVIVFGFLVYGGTAAGRGDGVVFAARFDQHGYLDSTFADHGLLIPRTLRDAGWGSLALQADGKILLAGLEDMPNRLGAGPHFVARYHPDGSPDLHFGGGGFASLPTGYSSQTGAIGRGDVKLALRADGRIVVGGALRRRDALSETQAIRFPVVYQIEGGTTPLPRFWREARAFEYFHAGFGHYFVTKLDLEIENLDVHASGGWARTGRSFRVWTEVGQGASPVCRFFSDQAFAPKSSHFYTSYAGECEQLKLGSVWKYEGNAFFLHQPVGMPGAGACPFGSRPLFRAYNNGMSGAPNHRYTTDPSLLDAMIAQGWTMEGEVQTRIFACVPLQG